MLKAYFLSDKHNRHVCLNGSKGLAVGRPFLGSDNGNGTGNGGGSSSSSGVGNDRERGCMCCEMDRAFEEVSQLTLGYG
jgi:ubiquitin carboxyl-terminal hydrolase 22/27/51